MSSNQVAIEVRNSEVEKITCYTPGDLERLRGDKARPLSWARIVWVDRSCNPGACGGLVDMWIARECVVDKLAWQHNQVYEIPAVEGTGVCRVKVGDIRDCSANTDPPDE